MVKDIAREMSELHQMQKARNIKLEMTLRMMVKSCRLTWTRTSREPAIFMKRKGTENKTALRKLGRPKKARLCSRVTEICAEKMA